MKPVIAIIGRPNVGKSTLFNRLIGRRKAIVIDEPGATRDRNYSDCQWRDSSFTLIDTGGFEPAAAEGILAQIREQTMLALEEADAILFIMDSREGLTPTDQQIVKILRTTQKKVFYTINKVDGPRHDPLLIDFYSLGIEPLYTISAQHGRGVDALMDDLVRSIPQVARSDEEDHDSIRMAIIGRPNVGKSSLVNRMLGVERSIANPIPGTTRDAIDSLVIKRGRKFVLIDTAGIRRKSRISLTLEKYSIVQAIKGIDRADIALVLIDALEGITDQDMKIAGLALERGTACIIVVNKWDLIDKDNNTFGAYQDYLHRQAGFLNFVPVIFVSATSGQRVEKIFSIAERIYEQYSKRIDTAELNKKLLQSAEMIAPSKMMNGHRFVKYITQTSTRPPTFVVFLKGTRKPHFSYERYLINRIRETLGFEEVPVRVFFRTKGLS